MWKGYNVADIDYTTKDGVRIIMPPLSPPEKCVGKMTMREDDKEETVRRVGRVQEAKFTSRGLV